MASAVIHMAVANEINKVLKRDNNLILIGSIAPDISKHIGQNKVLSHFLDTEDNEVPNIDRFLAQYRSFFDNDFVMGYFIHLYTDYLWFKYFLPEIYDKQMITKLDGSTFECNTRMLCMYMYNDYTNLNVRLIDEYNMNLNIFYSEPPEINPIIKEIPMDKISTIINATSVIIENSKVKKDLIFNIDNVNQFIELCINLILAKLKELSLLENKN